MKYISHKVVGPFNHIEILEGEDHRRVISPGDSSETECEAVSDAIEESHTPELIEAYQTHLEENLP